MRTRWPMAASSLCHQRRARASSTMATRGALATSLAAKSAPAPQRDPHGLEVLTADDGQPHHGRARRRARRRFRRGVADVALAAHRHVGDGPEPADAGHGRQPRRQLIVELRDAARVRVGLRGQIGLEADAIRRLEADVVLQQALQAAQRETGADHQRHGQRHFGDGQAVPHPAGRAAVRATVRAHDRPRSRAASSPPAPAPSRPPASRSRASPTVNSAAGRSSPTPSRRGTLAGA